MQKLLKVLGLSLLLLTFAVTAFGQAVSGDLVGTVTDKSGAVVANATVDVLNLGTGLKQTTTTTAQGAYHISNLPSGHYGLTVTSAGLKGGIKDIEIIVNKATTANVAVNIAAESSIIEVSAAAATIDTQTPSIQTTYDTRELESLPSASTGSGVINLALLNPGIASAGSQGIGSGGSISGQRPRNNNFTVEGVDNNSKGVTGPLVTIPADAVEEFTVLQNQFSPEFGHSSGGQFNQTIKGGSNSFHGMAYEYFMNRKLNAVDQLVANSDRSGGVPITQPRYDNNRFGGNFGGPVIKDKVFFFTNFEYQPIGEEGTGAAYLAPTAAGFSQLAALYPNSSNLAMMQKYVKPAASADTAAMQSNGLAYEAGDVSFQGGIYNNTLNTTNSIDFNISSKDQLRVRYIYQKNEQTDDSASNPAFWLPIPQRYHLFTLGEYHNFTPHVNNEFRFGFNRFSQFYSAGTLQFTGLAQFPNLTWDDLNGLSLGPNPNAPQSSIQNVYQLSNNVSWVKGKHTIKVGGEFRWYIAPEQFVQRARGDYEYASLGEYLSDSAPSTFGERSTGFFTYYGNQKAAYLFGNDEWRVTSNLTLNGGVRYEVTSNPEGENKQALNSISSVPGLINFGKPTVQKTNFAPRVGFAYSPGNSGNTSIRGGFSMAYDVLYDNLGQLSMPPQVSYTCDTTNAQTALCAWHDPATIANDTGFLANGGLPSSPINFGTDAALARANTPGFIPNQKLPYTETWNIGIQHVFAKNYTFEARYVGTHALNLPMQVRLNRQARVTASSYLPTYMSNPGVGVADTLPLTLAALNAKSSYVSTWADAGFNSSNVVGFMPYGGSKYNGLQTQFSRSFSNGLLFKTAWTWSHAFDNSTADVNANSLTERRPQDFQNVNKDWSASALDHRHRVTVAVVYDLPYFKHSNAFLKNTIGNWQISPVYTFESPEYATVQSNADANMNGDAAGDRFIVNPNGSKSISSGVAPLLNSNGDTVGYYATTPNAYYIRAQKGALANGGRNTLAMPRTDNIDLSLAKKVTFSEHQLVQFEVHAYNFFNHPQFIPGGSINDIGSFGGASSSVISMLTPGNSSFNQPSQVFSSNPRTLQLVLKYSF